MAGRIRTLKPELLEDEKTASLPDAAFRLFVSLILLADDHGNLRASPAWLEGQIWWCSSEQRDIRALLARLARRSRDGSGGGLVEFYTVHGQPYLHLSGWSKHQRVDKPSAPRVPRPDDGQKIATIPELIAIWDGLLADASRDPREDLAGPSRLTSDPDLRPRPPTTDSPEPAPPASGQEPLALPLGPRQEEALAALGSIPFRVSGWIRGEGTAAEILGPTEARSLAAHLGGPAYPAVPVQQGIAQAAAWCRTNPTKAKTPRGLGRFLTAWFEREQNRGGPRSAGAPPGPAAGAAQQDLGAKLREAGL